jgi:sulfoxide reductase heme-binding subunit YedZ
MTRFLERHGGTLALIALAAAIFIIEYRAVSDATRALPNAVQNPFLVAMGKWGIRFLLLSLAITPLITLTGWRQAARLRKPAGLLAFCFVAWHAGIYLLNARSAFDSLFSAGYLFIGFVAFVILLLMTLTSVQVAMRLLGKNWKRLHRLVYLAGICAVIHSLMAALGGKRQFYGGAESARELAIYAVVLAVLLALRLPFVRHILKRRRAGRPTRQSAAA